MEARHMTRTRIQKQLKTRKRGTYQAPFEAPRAAAGSSSQLLESVEDLLEEIDRALHDAGHS
jgi:hypothetical protein